MNMKKQRFKQFKRNFIILVFFLLVLTPLTAQIDKDDYVYDFAWGNGMFVAVGKSGSLGFISYSVDGKTWTKVTDNTFLNYKINKEDKYESQTREIYSVAWGNGKFVAVGENLVAYSADGKKWTRVANTERYIFCSVAWGNGKFVTSTDDNYWRIMYSFDGEIWRMVYDDAGKGDYQSGLVWKRFFGRGGDYNYQLIRYTTVSWGNGRWVMYNPSYGMGYSTDGEIWTWITGQRSRFGSINAVVCGSGKWVAVGNSGQMFYSVDGQIWTSINSPFGLTSILSVTYGNGKWVAIGAAPNPLIYYSNDGKTWIQVPLDDDFDELFYVSDRKVIFGNIVFCGNKFFISVKGNIYTLNLE